MKRTRLTGSSSPRHRSSIKMRNSRCRRCCAMSTRQHSTCWTARTDTPTVTTSANKAPTARRLENLKLESARKTYTTASSSRIIRLAPTTTTTTAPQPTHLANRHNPQPLLLSANRHSRHPRLLGSPRNRQHLPLANHLPSAQSPTPLVLRHSASLHNRPHKLHRPLERRPQHQQLVVPLASPLPHQHSAKRVH